MGRIAVTFAAFLFAFSPAAIAEASEALLAHGAESESAKMIAGDSTPPDPLSCVERVEIPQIEQASDLIWSPTGGRVAVTRIVRSPSRRTVTGYEEDPFIQILDVAKGRIDDIGPGMLPRWSGTGTYLAFWHEGHLRIKRSDGSPVTMLESSVPDVRWVGDELRYFFHDEIRAWTPGEDRLLSTLSYDHMPRYPRDDAYFSADGGRFLVSRYSLDGGVFRFFGEVATGQVWPLDAAASAHTEWAPTGQTLLVRNEGSVELVLPDGNRAAAPLSAFPGAVHDWTADGKLLMGKISPTIPVGAAIDTFKVWEDGAERTAKLPNLIGSRAFSPDGRFFAGIARTALFDATVEVYRCGTRAKAPEERADPVARARQQAIDTAGRRFVRPVPGYISQFLQGLHTGIDVAAPFGATITAVDEGHVTFVGWVPVGGRAVCVQHYEGIESCYYHTAMSYVTVGQWVSRGEAIAAIGMTGLTSGPHVHWEVKHHGRIVDPLQR